MKRTNPIRTPPKLSEERWKEFQKELIVEILKSPDGYIHAGEYFCKKSPRIAEYMAMNPLIIDDRTRFSEKDFLQWWSSSPKMAYEFILERIELTKKKLTK